MALDNSPGNGGVKAPEFRLSQPSGVVTTTASNWDSDPSAVVIDIVGGADGRFSTATTLVLSRILAFVRAAAATVLKMAVKLDATTHSSTLLISGN